MGRKMFKHGLSKEKMAGNEVVEVKSKGKKKKPKVFIYLEKIFAT